MDKNKERERERERDVEMPSRFAVIPAGPRMVISTGINPHSSSHG